MDVGIIGSADGPTVVLLAGEIGYEWNWINLFGAIIVVLLLVPNIVYAVKCRGEKNLCDSKLLNLLEQIGRYGSMLFMIVYMGPKSGFGFKSAFSCICYGVGNICFLAAYWSMWITYFKKTGMFGKKKGASAVFVAGYSKVLELTRVKMALAILPGALFFLNGMILEHILLMAFSVLFAVCHILVTRENIKKSVHKKEGSTSDDI